MRHGAGFRGALRPPTRASRGRGRASAVCGFPLSTPGDTYLFLSPSSCPQSPPPTQHTGLAHPGPAQLSPQQRQLLIERWLVTPVAPPESGRDGQRRGGARSGGAGVRTNTGRLAPSPPPSPAGCREGAQRRRGLPGSPQRCDGVSAARARGEGPSALIRQGRALASDNHPPEPGPGG